MGYILHYEMLAHRENQEAQKQPALYQSSNSSLQKASSLSRSGRCAALNLGDGAPHELKQRTGYWLPELQTRFGPLHLACGCQ